ncbi:hypothetical protein ATANTOWER_018615 [Ataeniobius toweri]|uniref:Uncharacterized protein n=1 Tax=Ataeniobius toweri TaxID=208326 RepID=A0ABU7C2M6_9TELE|nr:hypothetical protein [Ataeniobius toweri]
MDNKDSSYLKTSSFRSSSLHFGPSKTHFMTEGTSQRDQAGGMGLVDVLPPLPAPVPGPVLEGSEDKLPPSLVPVPEEFVDKLSPLPVSVPEGCEDAPSLRRRSPRPHRRPQRFQPLRRRPADRLPLRRRPADRLPLSGRPADRQIGRGQPADRRIGWGGPLIAGPAGDGLQAGRMNSPLVPYVMCMCDLVCWLPCQPCHG